MRLSAAKPPASAIAVFTESPWIRRSSSLAAHVFSNNHNQNRIMNLTEYQLETLRARFAARGYQPLNHRRSRFVPWFATGMAIGSIAAFILFF